MSERLISIAQSAERSGSNPLECQLCHMELVRPVRLACQHYFCYDCLAQQKVCPLCARRIEEVDVCEDSVLAYVIESSHERTEICANCDQVLQPMYFCETCQQPLCGRCRELTHKAKIFVTHHITLLEERGRLRGRVICGVHNEPFIVFCLDSKNLMCIECFNASSLERKGNFVNIDLAHKICCDKLEKAVTRLRMFQDELSEQIELRRRFATELENNFSALILELETNCESVIELIRSLKCSVMNRLKVEKNEKEKIIEAQLQCLQNLQHIMSNKMERLAMSSELFMNFKHELAKEFSHEFFGGGASNEFSDENASSQDHHYHHLHFQGTDNYPRMNSTQQDLSFPLSANSRSAAAEISVSGEFSAATRRRSSADDGVSVNFDDQTVGSISVRLMGDLNATFTEYLHRIDAPLKGFTAQISTLSKALVDVQRDITLRRCVVGKDDFLRLLNSCEKLKSDLDDHFSIVNNHIQPVFRELWHEQAERVQQQKMSYREKLDEMLYLQRFAEKVVESAQQLQPFAFYIAAIISTLDERRTQVVNFSPMEQICLQISSLEPDSQQRVEAIEKEEESRRVAKIQEKLAAIPEAQLAMKNLKETRMPTLRPQTTVVVVEDRDRASQISLNLSAKSTGKRKPRKDNHSSDGNTSGVCSPLPIIFSPAPLPSAFSPSTLSCEPEFSCSSSLVSSITPPCGQRLLTPPSHDSQSLPLLPNNVSPFDTNKCEHSAVTIESLKVESEEGAPAKISSIFGDDVVRKSNDIDGLLSLQIANKNFQLGLTSAAERVENAGGHSTAMSFKVDEKSEYPLPALQPILCSAALTKNNSSDSILATKTAGGSGKLCQLSPQMQTIANLIELQLKGASASFPSITSTIEKNSDIIEMSVATSPKFTNNFASVVAKSSNMALINDNVADDFSMKIRTKSLAEEIGTNAPSPIISHRVPPPVPPPPPHSAAISRSSPYSPTFTTTDTAPMPSKPTAGAQSALSKIAQQNPGVMSASEETVKARNLLLASIKERVKRIE